MNNAIAKFPRNRVFLCLFTSTLALALNGCSNANIAPPVANGDPFWSYRWFVLVMIPVLGFMRFFILAAISDSQGASKEGKKLGFGLLVSLLGAAFTWTKLGEWGYLLWNWFFGISNPLVAIFGFLTGITANIPSIFIAAFLLGFTFPSPSLFCWVVIPMIAGLILNMLLVSILLFLANLAKANRKSQEVDG